MVKIKSNQVDWIGIILLASFIGSLQFVLEHGQQDDWFNSPLISALSTLSIWIDTLYLETASFNIQSYLSVLKDGNLRIGTLMSFILGFGLYGSH
jgi:DHA2 family multidrug resistance protein